jgi:uncharacterized UBP type Zn finger protein
MSRKLEKISNFFRVLIILLMRLRNDGSKNDYEVTIEKTLNLREFVHPLSSATTAEFNLTGIISHRGDDIQSGEFC